MMTAILVTFVLTTMLCGALGAWGMVRLLRDLRTNSRAAQVVMDLLMPGKQEEFEKKRVQKETKLS